MHVLEHSEVWCLALSADGALLATGAKDGVRLWSSHTGTQLATRTGVGPVEAVCFTPEGEHLLVGGKDGMLRRWAFHAGADVERVQWEQSIRALAVDARTGRIAAGLIARGGLLVMRVVVLEPHGASAELFSNRNAWGQWSLAFSPDGRDLAVLNVDGHGAEGASFAVVEVATRAVIQEQHAGTLYGAGSVSYSPAGQLAVGPNFWRPKKEGIGVTGFAVLESGRSLAPWVEGGWEEQVVFLSDGGLVSRDWSTLRFRPQVREEATAILTLPEGGPELALLTAAARAPVVATTVGDNRVLVGSVDELLRQAAASG